MRAGAADLHASLRPRDRGGGASCHPVADRPALATAHGADGGGGEAGRGCEGGCCEGDEGVRGIACTIEMGRLRTFLGHDEYRLPLSSLHSSADKSAIPRAGSGAESRKIRERNEAIYSSRLPSRYSASQENGFVYLRWVLILGIGKEHFKHEP